MINRAATLIIGAIHTDCFNCKTSANPQDLKHPACGIVWENVTGPDNEDEARKARPDLNYIDYDNLISFDRDVENAISKLKLHKVSLEEIHDKLSK